MEKILVLYGSYGGGHKSAANAIKQYIENNYSDKKVEMIDCVEYVSKFINKITVGMYNKLTRSAPGLWKKVYFNSEKGFLSKLSNGSNKLMTKKFYKLIKNENPSHIICTHMFASQMCGILKRKGKLDCDVSTILTDYEIHNQWLQEYKYIDRYFVAHSGMKKSMIEKGIDENKIYDYGIPISERFSETFNREEVLKKFNFDNKKKIALFFGGGAMGLGKEKTCEILKVLSKDFLDIQIIAISGKNQEMNNAFNKIVSENNCEDRIKVLEFTNKVPEYMSISDLVITKPGGLTTTESLASGLPILVINPLPGQEEQNAEFIEKNKVGIWLKKDDNVKDILNMVILDDEKLKQMSKNAKNIVKKDSTRKICEEIFG